MNVAIILASGTGTRFGSDTPKQFMKLAGKTVLEHTLDVFERHAGIDELVVVTSADNLMLTERIVLQAGYKKVRKIVTGGDTRQESSAAGISAIEGDEHKVLVHDAVRPLLDHSTIDRCLAALDLHRAVDTAIPSSDTVIRLADDGTIADIPDRSRLQLGQTPQAFHASLLREAHLLASRDPNLKVTDDCGLILRYDLGNIAVVSGNVDNIKITYPSDIYLADRLFQVRARPIELKKTSNLDLAGKVLVVFGASRGIGASTVTIAAAQGAHVISASRSDGVDISDPAAVRSTLEQAKKTFGRVDAVINTAGLLRTGLLSGQSYETIDEQISINLRGSFIVARESFECMRSAGGSIALFTSSSYTRGRARYSVYSATKAAIVNMMQALAEEFYPFNVRINAINPERTATPMRIENFGSEPADQLLMPDVVALATLETCLGSGTGEVIDVRR